jgi:hypothetical protein
MRYLRWIFTVALLSIWYVVGMAVVSALAPVDVPERPATVVVEQTPTLPSCPDEEGAGMALCWWDAQAQGNGKGTSVVSGDCAPSIMGDEASKACVILHSRESKIITNESGSTSTIPNGADLVGECIQEQSEIAIAECIKGWLE